MFVRCSTDIHNLGKPLCQLEVALIATHTILRLDLPEVVEQIIQENLWSTPSVLTAKIQEEFSHVSAQQVYRAWATFSPSLWKQADNQMETAHVLIEEMSDEANLLDIQAPDSVEALGWALKKINNQLKGWIIEVAVDATCK
jgi:hypothetical protein